MKSILLYNNFKSPFNVGINFNTSNPAGQFFVNCKRLNWRSGNEQRSKRYPQSKKKTVYIRVC